jgi:hypothetical protein
VEIYLMIAIAAIMLPPLAGAVAWSVHYGWERGGYRGSAMNFTEEIARRSKTSRISSNENAETMMTHNEPRI